MLRNIQKDINKCLLLLMAVCMALPAAAKLRQDSNGYYMITTKADYLEMLENYLDYRKRNIALYDDIDLEGDVITPFGTSTYPFMGVFDGRGHVIKNAKIYWNDISYSYGYGMFGYLNGNASTTAEVCNLVIDNFELTIDPNSPIFTYNEAKNDDMRLGVLAGGSTQYAKVHDISILNSKINDANDNRGVVVRAMMCGGVIGDIANAVGDSQDMASALQLCANVFCHVDISLKQTKKTTDNAFPQFFVGGIVGRIRSATKVSHIPFNTVFTGTIEAPYGSESPTVDNMRWGLGNDYNNLVGTYAGEALTKQEIFHDNSNYGNIVPKAVYYNYHAYNSANGTTTEVNANIPSGGTYYKGTRTFADNANGGSPLPATITTQEEWAKVQGVNWGTWKDPANEEADRTAVVDMLNSQMNKKVTGTNDLKYYWEWKNGKFGLLRRIDPYDDIEFVVEINDLGTPAVAKLYYKGTKKPYTASGTFKWQTATKATASENEWTDVAGNTSDTMPIAEGNTLFYRAIWTSDTDSILQLTSNAVKNLVLKDRYQLVVVKDPNSLELTATFKYLETLEDVPAAILNAGTLTWEVSDNNGSKWQTITGENGLSYTMPNKAGYSYRACWKRYSLDKLNSNKIDLYILDNKYYLYSTTDNSGYVVTAHVCERGQTDPVEDIESQGEFYWERTTDPSTGNWEVIPGETTSTYQLPFTTGYTYRVSWSIDTALPPLVSKEYEAKNLADTYEVRIEFNSDATELRMRVYRKGTDIDDTESIIQLGTSSCQWQVSSTPTEESSWTNIEGATDDTFAVPGAVQEFYRVVWTLNGVEIISDFKASRTVVYVFDRGYTDHFRNIFTVAEGARFDYLYDNNGNCIYHDGDDANSGNTPDKAVKTMKRAFELLNSNGDVNSNRIVIMGYYHDPNYLPKSRVPLYSGDYAIPTTITSTDNLTGLENGILVFYAIENDYTGMQAPLRFDRIDLAAPVLLRDVNGTYTKEVAEGNRNIYLACNYFDLTIDQNVRFLGYRDAPTSWGLPEDITSMPCITIIMATEDSNSPNSVAYPDRKGWNATNGYSTFTARSGVFGRVILGGRNTGGGVNASSKNIVGSPELPCRSKYILNIEDDINLDDKSKDNDRTKFGLRLLKESGSGKYYYGIKSYTHNVALIAGGQTDGSVYGDMEINIRNGYVGRVLAGSITFGRTVTGFPSDSFFGKAVTNVYGAQKAFVEDGEEKIHYTTTVNEIYGGTLGRKSDRNPEQIEAYFYGQSYINIYGGRIAHYSGAGTLAEVKTQYPDLTAAKATAVYNKLVSLSNQIPSVYGAGGGGASGVGDTTYHTTDPHIPYYKKVNNNYQLSYGTYAQATASDCQAPEMLVNINQDTPETINLHKTDTYVNIYSGLIEGNVYGGGYGFSNNIPIGSSDFIPGCRTEGAVAQAGILYGNSYVRMLRNADLQPAVVLGNIYGGGAGDKSYADYHRNNNTAYKGKFDYVGTVYGNTYVELTAGTVGDGINANSGNVYGGSKGVQGYENIGCVYGKTELIVDGATIYGNIFGGSGLANIRRRETKEVGADTYELDGKRYVAGTGDTHVTIRSGIIGNNIFGGSEGCLGAKTGNVEPLFTKAVVSGNTYVNIEGGDFLDNPYIDTRDLANVDGSGQLIKDGVSVNVLDNKDLYRSFNIYGGGYLNSDVKGTAHVNVSSSLLASEASFVNPAQNPNALAEYNHSIFHSAYMDVTFRRFCVYGAGYGENTNVLNTNVYVTIPMERPGVTLPHGFTLDNFLEHQSFFDIAGGGYSGDVGYWENAEGVPVAQIDFTQAPYTVGGKVNPTEVVKQYDHYVGGLCQVTIDDYTYARKVIGGGFYGSCRATNTHVRCGSLRQVYGGSLLGYVHDKAYLQFGNRTEDFIGKVGSSYVHTTFKAPVDEAEPFDGDINDVPDNIWSAAEGTARQYNDYIFITENIYGGNDVKGIIGTKMWEAEGSTPANPIYGLESTDYSPMYQTDVEKSEEKGIVFNIYGGTFMGDVYGAGNGHYRGYYVPGWVRYEDGPARMYRSVHPGNETRTGLKGRVYRSRPMVGSININIRGNSVNDSIRMRGNFFGGGRECTIGQWDTFLPMEDPRRLLKGGHLHVNVGGYVSIAGNMYMGAEGNLYSQQHTVPGDIDLRQFNGETTTQLARLGDTAYDHWYFKTDATHDKGGYYVPGFPAPGEVDGNFGMTGEHMMRAYMKNIEMEGDVELTFYRYLYERDSKTNQFLYHPDPKDPTKDMIDATGQKVRVRKHWVPAEISASLYDAPEVRMHSFFLGGLCGSMTNNDVMIYNYEDGQEYDESERQQLIDNGTNEKQLEKWGAVYRISLPRGVTLRENVVMGSENATTKYYPYNSTYTDIIKTQEVDGVQVDSPYYVYEGGMVTHSAQAFDLIAYNDICGLTSPARQLPDDFYTGSNPNYSVRDKDEWEVQNGPNQGTKIYRYAFTEAGHRFPTKITTQNLYDPRYALAVTKDAKDPSKVSAYVGVRENRRESGTAITDPTFANHQTMVKLGMRCNFDLATIPGTDASNPANRYGGNVYGGCYNSGIVIGDVVMNLAGSQLGNDFDEEDFDALMEYSKLKYNIGRVFGGGFGKETRTDGDTYVNLLLGFKGMNVFGGGMEGDVNGTTNIRYIGDEYNSFVYGSIYGGGLRGSVGIPEQTEIATKLRLVSGNVRNAYGGSCMGDLYGRTFVELTDEVEVNFTHLDLDKMTATTLMDDWGGSRLIVSHVYGGNDIAGNIVPYIAPATGTPVTPSVEDFGKTYTTSVLVHEVQDAPGSQSGASSNTPGKTSPGAAEGYNGFPLIGDLYGGSNSDYGQLGDTEYTAGEIELSTGIGTSTITVQLGGDPTNNLPAYAIPHVDRSIMHLHGGTIINAYGGGNMSTITEEAKIDLNYPVLSKKARAGFATEAEFDRVWKVLQFSSDQQQDEVTEVDEDGQQIFNNQIYRLFGGNNNANMAIQPTWNLLSGQIGSLYSGGNFGKMTYFDPAYDYASRYNIVHDGTNDSDWQSQGLTLTLNSYDLEVGNVYGGGRVGDVSPDVPAGITPDPRFYGATLNIVRGIIEHVYGGNDVAGYVDYGTNVNIYGAISGDVYCAGNGNYLYKYDRQGDLYDYSDTRLVRISENYEYATDEYKGSRFFQLPAKADYGFNIAAPTSYNATDAQTIMAINSYRPNVERTQLYIAGSADNRVWIKGSVYCGGNSSTVVQRHGASSYDVEFKIGSHVVINGVFMGSNGYALTDGPKMIYNIEKLNGIGGGTLNMIGANDLTTTQIPLGDRTALNKNLYPTILDLYMRAVEIKEAPKDFSIPANLEDAYIGEFCVGGNRGSMMTSKTITLNFPETLTLYGRIIGGCKDANVTYNGVTHEGGLTQPLSADANGVKVDLTIKSKFRPLSILYPDVEVIPPISLNDYMVGPDGESIMIDNPAFDPTNPSADVPEKIVDPSKGEDERYYHDQQCNIYGGCFTSGTTIGDINIALYSDMLRYDEEDCIDKRAVINGINDVRSWRSFTVVGGGYGALTTVRGDINVKMLPNVSGEGGTRKVTIPSVASVFAGSQEGLIVGNTNLEIRAGKVLANAYGASEAAIMYGNTNVIIGYPKYYRAKQSGIYKINRTDYMSKTARENLLDDNHEIVVPHTIAYTVGDRVPNNIHQIMLGRVKNADATSFVIGTDVADTDMDVITDANIDNYFEEVTDETPAAYGAKWDDIVIWIGDQASNTSLTAPYYGHGNVYGGGYVPNSSNIALTGVNTVLRFTKDNHPYRYDENAPASYNPQKDYTYVGYGGNANVMIWDNHENADYDKNLDTDRTADGSPLVDHVHIGTGRIKEKSNVAAGSSRMGLYIYDETQGIYVYQTAGEITAEDIASGVKFYEKNADGGVYGGGRKVFVEGFRSIDLAYYGYAGHTPQKPKLLNTLQRADMATVTDCCMELIGASDFTIDDSNNTLYAINRVGELRMYSSLDPEQPLKKGEVDPNHSNIITHNDKRSRNFIAFYHAVNHLAAFSSNWRFEHKYHKDDGKVTTQASTDPYNNSGLQSFVTHKHDIIELYEHLNACKRSTEHGDHDELIEAYNAYVAAHPEDGFETFTPTDDAADDYSRISAAITSVFNQRNVATSANMIGINSGYALRFEGLNADGVYYGPVYGVTEIKLLTVAIGEGGGYVYALNHHYDPAVDGNQVGVATEGWCSEYGHDFLMTTGNFVFPGAAYFMEESGGRKYNFIIDDCYPMTKGYYDYEAEHNKAVQQHRAAGTFNVNDRQEVHYWYISGNTYTFNVNVTGITSDKNRNFYLNNEDDMVNLVSVRAGTDIKIKSVKWFKHNEGESCETDGCDLRNLDKDYQLFFTVDHNSNNTYSYEPDSCATGAYVAAIPRRNYERQVTTDALGNEVVTIVREDGEYTDNGTTVPYEVDPNAGTGTFGNYVNSNGVSVENNPRLGIRLVDNWKNRLEDQDPSAGRAYYNEHLSSPHQLQVVIETKNEGEGTTFTYIINLTIDYVLGPLITGQIEIENCALPGEYIYANANNVYVDVDGENFGIVKQYWKLYPNDKAGHRIDANGRILSKDNFVIDEHGVETEIASTPVFEDLSQWGIFTLEHTEKVVHVPAYWYQNGWELTYIVNVNGFEFESTLPFDMVDPNDATKRVVIPGNRLQVHNYHRMKPKYTGNLDFLTEYERDDLLLEPGVLDLKLVKGARVYIENNEDLEYFLKYLSMHQSAEYDALTPLGERIGPRYGEGIDFHQKVEATLPATFATQHDLIFRGNYHGNGHTMTIPPTLSLNFHNEGAFYNLGFVSQVNNDNTKAFYNNRGSLYNCYYFNIYGKGTFLGGDSKASLGLLDGHKIVNCYQNTLSNEKLTQLGYAFNEMLHISTIGFRYGQVAYNLNSYYLQKRHKLLHDAGAANNAYALEVKDRELRLTSEYTDYAVPYVENLYNDGDYRYAYYQENPNDGHFTSALRTSEVPNYLDRMNQRANSLPVSMHKYTHDTDEARWCEYHQTYHPNFETDYLFFGEDLTVDVDEHNTELPQPYTAANRVYRVGGFYGSAADKGYFLNRNAWLDTPLMTAVDFVGYRDRDLYEGGIDALGNHGALKEADRLDIETNGWVIKQSPNAPYDGRKGGWQEIYMAPTLDVPWTWDDENGTNLRHDFHNFAVNSDIVTHNLLVYTQRSENVTQDMSQFHYTDQSEALRVQLGKDEHSFAEHHESAIVAHHILEDYDGNPPTIYGDYFQLVDKHDFNAPVAFKVRQAWYNRQPHDYADEYADGEGYLYKTAWEGICLPFDVAKTYASSTNPTVQKDDMGEITHFFDADTTSHEYWLRRFAALDGDKMIFERPTTDNKGAGSDSISNYHFHNSTLYDLYREYGYDQTNVSDHHHDVLYHDENAPLDRTIANYRHLSRSIPYIVAYPGERYYEFDLSGKFYASKNSKITTPVPQAITYFAKYEDVEGEYMIIPVTDSQPLTDYSYGGYTVKGTFQHVTNDADMAESVLYAHEPNLGVLDAYYPASGAEVHHGEEFVGASSKAVVEPFRVYATKASGKFGAPQRIAAKGAKQEQHIEVDEPQEPETPEDEVVEGVKVWVDNHTLIIQTPEDHDFYIFNMLGQKVRYVRAFAGKNRYSGLPTGFYVVNHTKFKI